MSQLFQLVEYKLPDFQKTWLRIHDICLLDTALCSSAYRETFQAFLKGDVMFDGLEERLASVAYINWLWKKSIKVRALDLGNRLVNCSNIEYFEGFESVKCITYKNSWKECLSQFSDIVAECSNLIVLNFLHSRLGTVLRRYVFRDEDRKLYTNIIESLPDTLLTFNIRGSKLVCIYSILSLIKRCNMTHIDVSYCELYLHDEQLIELANCCPDLQVLEIAGYEYLKEVSLVHVATVCKKLTTLNICRCFRGCQKAENFISLLTNITDLNLHSTIIHENAVPAIAVNCPKLTRLNLGGGLNTVQYKALMLVAENCKFITDLNIDEVVSWKALRVLYKIPKLRKFSSWDRFLLGFDDVFDFLAADKLQYVEELRMRGDKVYGFELNMLYPGLSTTDIAKGNAMEAADAESGMSMFGHCESADTFRESYVVPARTDVNVFESISLNCPLLTSLSVADAHSLTDAVLWIFARHQNHLKKLAIVKCKNVTEDGLTTIIEANRKTLTWIELQWVGVTNKTANMIAYYCGHILRNLILIGSSMSDKSLSNIAYSCPKLELLDICSCTRITKKSFQDVLDCCKNLTSVYFNNTKIAHKYHEELGEVYEVNADGRTYNAEMYHNAEKYSSNG